MKILMLLERVFPQDERVEKEIRSLLDAGHEVRIATYTFNEMPKEEAYQGYVIYRKHISKIIYKLSAASLVFPYYNRFWRKYVHSIFTHWKFDAIHIHDLPLALLGTEMKKKEGIVFVADQHEYYSNWIVKTAHYNTPVGKIVKALSPWKNYEMKHLRYADLVCTVEEPLRELYIRERGVEPEKIIVIPNTPLSEIYQAPEKKPDPDRFTLYYHGGLDRLRGLDVALEAVALLKESIPEIRLVLVGELNKHNDLMQKASDLGVEHLVELKGWIDYRALPEQIDQADICFFTPPANRDELHNTIATKIYQYLGRAKPMIVGSARYMKQFVEKHHIGLAIDENQPQEFADSVLSLYNDRELLKKLGENARKHRSSYFWEHTVSALIAFYKS